MLRLSDKAITIELGGWFSYMACGHHLSYCLMVNITVSAFLRYRFVFNVEEVRSYLQFMLMREWENYYEKGVSGTTEVQNNKGNEKAKKWTVYS